MTIAMAVVFLTAGLICLAASNSRYQTALLGRTMGVRQSAPFKRFGPVLVATASGLCLVTSGPAKGAVCLFGLTTLGGALVTMLIALRRR